MSVKISPYYIVAVDPSVEIRNDEAEEKITAGGSVVTEEGQFLFVNIL